MMEFPWWLRWKRIRLQCRRLGLDPWVGKITQRRECLQTLVFLPGEYSHQSLFSPNFKLHSLIFSDNVSVSCFPKKMSSMRMQLLQLPSAVIEAHPPQPCQRPLLPIRGQSVLPSGSRHFAPSFISFVLGLFILSFLGSSHWCLAYSSVFSGPHKSHLLLL